MKSNCLSIIAGLVVLASAFFPLSANASDTEYFYHWSPGDPTLLTLENAGVATGIDARYNSATKQFSFSINLLPPNNNPANYHMKSFALGVSNGPYPHFGGGQYAIYYFDATNINSPKLTVYPYNAYEDFNDSLSYLDAHPEDGNLTNNPPDRICTSLNPQSCPGWLVSLIAQNESNGSRTFAFTVNVAQINAYNITWPNTAGLPWEGTNVGSTIGIFMIGYGHPTTAYSYRQDGFINEFFTPVGNDHLNLYNSCLMDAFTFRLPYCDGATGNYSVQVGQPFSVNFRGVSPDNRNLTVTYSGLPAGSTVDPTNGSTVQGTANGTFNWTPASNQETQSFNVNVVYTEATTGRTASCPFSLNVPGLGCSDVNVTNKLLTLDGYAKQQETNVKKLTKKYVRTAKTTSQKKKAKAYQTATNKTAHALFIENWSKIWTIPQVITTCTNAQFCVTTSHVSALNVYNANTNSLYALAEKTANLIKKAKGNATKLLTTADELRDAALAESATIPSSSTSCS